MRPYDLPGHPRLCCRGGRSCHTQNQFDADMTRELIETRIGACGCPEEVWNVDGIEVSIHFENDPIKGPHADAWADGGDWDILNRHDGEPDAAREAALAFVE